MKRYEKSPYDFKQIQRYQQLLDEADPFLVESLSARNDEELLEYAQNFEKHYDMAMQSQNYSTRKQATETRNVILSMLEMRRLMSLLERVENEENDGLGGVTFT